MRAGASGLAVAVAAFALGFGASAAWMWLSPLGPSEPSPSPTSAAASALQAPAPVVTPSPVLPLATPSATAAAAGFSKHAFLLDTPASPWVVVNKRRPLEPQDYVPPELVELTELPGGGGQYLIPEAAEALRALHAAADAEGAGFRVSTAYRSYERQREIFADYVRRLGTAKAELAAARPGYSEHQTGRAVDIYTTAECRLKQCFADTPAGRFVAAHAHEHGFIVRYPEGKTDVTGYEYEPWHLRYVGVELATEMHVTGPYTMEEFFDLPPAPDYLD